MAVPALALCVVLASAGCNLLNQLGSSPSSPSTTPAETTSGTLGINGSALVSFTVTQAGAVTVTLTGLAPTSVPVGLGLGTPTGTSSCSLTSSTSTAVAGSTPQISVTENPGTYCVDVYDVGNLTVASTFTLAITHS